MRYSKQKLRRFITFLFTLALFLAGARSASAINPRSYAFNVNSTVDENDAVLGDGICSSYPSGKCTLRAAITEANRHLGDDTINLPAGIYTLNYSGADDDANSSGDLDIRGGVTIYGPPSGAVTIQAATSAPTKVSGKGRVFDIHPPQSPQPSFSVSIQNVTIRHGFAPARSQDGGAIRTYSGLSLFNCLVTRSVAADGFAGGIAVLDNGYLHLHASTVLLTLNPRRGHLGRSLRAPPRPPSPTAPSPGTASPTTFPRGRSRFTARRAGRSPRP